MSSKSPSSPSSSKTSHDEKRLANRRFRKLLAEKEGRHVQKRREDQKLDTALRTHAHKEEAAVEYMPDPVSESEDDGDDESSESHSNPSSPAHSKNEPIFVDKKTRERIGKELASKSSTSGSSSASRLRTAGDADAARFDTKDSIEEASVEDDDSESSSDNGFQILSKDSMPQASDEMEGEEEEEGSGDKEVSDSEEEAVEMARTANMPRGSVMLSSKSRGSVVAGERIKGKATGLSLTAHQRKNKKKKVPALGESMDTASSWLTGRLQTAGLIIGISPNKRQRKWMKRTWTKMKTKTLEAAARVRGETVEDADEQDETAEDDEGTRAPKDAVVDIGGIDDDKSWGSSDSEVERMKSAALQRKADRLNRQKSPSQTENLVNRARESLGIPDDEAEYGRWLRLQNWLGILDFRIRVAVRTIEVSEDPPSPGLKAFVDSFRFEMFIGVMIGFNAIISGMDAMYKPGEPRDAYITIFENIFVFVFVVEYFLRLKCDTWVWMFQPMNMFDTFTVWVTGVLVVWILEPLGIEINLLRRTAALRVLRFGRIARAVRTVPMFHELWMLVSGVLECTRLLFWSGIIIGAVHFMFAVTVMEVVTKSEVFRDDELVNKLFGDLAYSVFTLFQIMTFDSWAGIVRHIQKKMPEAAAIFFMFMGIAGIVLFNLMTAIVVKNAFDAADADEEAKAQQLVTQQAKVQADLKEMFIALDEDGSGTLSREEFTDVLNDVTFIKTMKKLDIDLEELPDIFDILDDGDGNITTDEFCIGLTRLQGVAMSREMLKCTAKNKMLNASFNQVSETMGIKVDKTLSMIEGGMEASHENMVELQQMTAELLKKLEEVGIHRTVRSTTEGMEELAVPTLEMVAEKEENESREADYRKMMASMAAQQGLPPPIEEPEPERPQKGVSYKAIPASFSINRKNEIDAKKKAAMQKKLVENKEKTFTMDAEEELPLPGVPLEFQDTWQGLEVNPKRKTPLERIAAIKAAQTKYGQAAEKEKQEKEAKGIVDRQLPSVLPAVLAPVGSVDGIMAKPQEAAPEEAEEDKQDLTKLSVKELKAICAELEIEVVKGTKKAQLIKMIQERREEIENEGKTPLTLL